MASLDVSNFILDPQQATTSEGVKNYASMMERNKQISYQQQKEQEAEQWKKLNLIQDLTDLSKHQTADDVANAIGNQHASEIFNKYTAAAGQMSPAELQYNISKDMQGVTNGLDSMKNELAKSDQMVTALKTKFPSLDITALAKDSRADILNRRLKNGSEFTNPLEVPQSTMDYSNPDFLSKYVTGNKGMTEEIINPKGADDVSVYKGNPNQYTKYSAKIPYWKKPSYDPEKLNNGFMTDKSEPSLQIKGTTLPSASLPSSNGKPFKIVDEDVYNRFTNDESKNIELIKATRDQYPQYDTFNNQEKDYAKRNVLYKNFEALDQSQFHPTDIHAPSASLLKFYAGGSTSKADAEIRDIYGEVSQKVEGGQDLPFGLGKGVQMNELSPTAQKVILEYANKLIGNGVTQSDIALVKGKDGVISIVSPEDGKVIAPIDFGDINVQAQPGIKEKRKVIQETNREYNLGNKKFTHSQIEKAAAQSGMTIDEYIKEAGIK